MIKGGNNADSIHPEIPWSRRSIFWSVVCAIACLSRSSSYLLRPPEEGSLSQRTIEQVISYPQWSAVLFILGVATLVITKFQFARVGLIVHLLNVLCYTIFTFTLLGGAITQGDPWSGIYPTAVVALVNAERCLTLGAIVRIEGAARVKQRQRSESG